MPEGFLLGFVQQKGNSLNFHRPDDLTRMRTEEQPAGLVVKVTGIDGSLCRVGLRFPPGNDLPTDHSKVLL